MAAIFLKSFSDSEGRNCGFGTERALTNSFEIYTVNSLIKKKFETIFIMFEASFGVAQSKQNKNTIIILKESSGSCKSCLN